MLTSLQKALASSQGPIPPVSYTTSASVMFLQQGHAAPATPFSPALTFHGACLTPAKNNPLLLDKIHHKPLLQPLVPSHCL